MLELHQPIANDGSMDSGEHGDETKLEKGRARWRSRRGMLELDLVLVAFVENEFDSLSSEEKGRYVELLGLEDFELWDWLQGVREPPPEFENLIGKIAAAAGP